MKIINKFPESELEILTPQRLADYKLPLFLESVSAGFPSPADDYLEDRLDINELLIRNPSATFFVRVIGNSMINAGIHSGDILVVDRSLEAKDGAVVIAVLDGELTVKTLRHLRGSVYLYPENDNFKPIRITKNMNFEIWGVVCSVIHSFVHK